MYNITLPSDEVPKHWYNINPDLPIELPMPIDGEGGHQVENLPIIFTKAVLEQEMSMERYIKIPKEVRDIYQRIGRPTPLFRAKSLEEKLNTPAKIYYKREDSSPAGSHKLNSALAQAYYAREEGVEKLTTETGAGQWGSALALACSMMGIECDVYMVKVSYNQKPFRKTVMELYNSNIYASPSMNTDVGRKINKETPEHPGSLGIAISEAIEVALANENTKYSLGSVLNHVMLHQTVIGQELKKQLEIAEEEPDVFIACVGGGSNFAGSMYPLIKDKLDGKIDAEFLAVEPSSCPTLTKGSYEYDFGDTEGFTPMLKMFTLGHDFIAPSVHAGGLRYHGMSPQVSVLAKANVIKPVSAAQEDIFKAAQLFASTEAIIPAPESSHALKIGIDEAKKAKETGEEKTIVINLSGHGLLDLQGYSDFLSGNLTQ
ncbi:TrpB-like pyridoxal phosphate-dependent enzyme [Methanobrevibacter curvatus]|uniref:Tryptophan synthase beta chain n=1 Tax=Methanobrevibacter curvatus TaxID=49547 RepID=A0A166CCC5_9EURY|nr:TrpB-like pyridoxal phosphate-dependent enzyme [Methanobrevibacter curvatus]KZX13087.1 tryptophan synthase beta chain [Methanobrevibacter curvatus]